ncbi:6738_t:CDS:2 [Dentiscutata erythropus]|uniref:6738_t:CDS:1 n=1 Tax=Dentiscutata erythropus TaxID=1348616 RepID=A0A9N9GJI7_9GLOM|nr:6738_t:CDS:2 [Dentiscutata erythropus]
MVKILKPFEEITRHVCSAKYPTINFVYPYVRMLKNKYAPIAEKDKSIESWLDLIYRPSSDFEEIANSDTSVSSDDEADIPSAGSKKQWQYTHAHQKEVDDSDVVRYLPSANFTFICSPTERRNIENQIREELLVLEPNRSNSNTERTQTTIEKDYDSLSAKLWGPHLIPVLQQST